MTADNQAKHTFILPEQTSALNCSCEVITWPEYLGKKKFKNDHKFLQYNLKFVSNITASDNATLLSCSLRISWSSLR